MDSAPLPTPKASLVLNGSRSLTPDEFWATFKSSPSTLLKWIGASLSAEQARA